MGFNVNTNVVAIHSTTTFNTTQRRLMKTLDRVTSGLRITESADDAAGLGVAEKLDALSRSLTIAQRNVNDGISVVQTAEKAVSEVAGILGRMRELAIQSASETLHDQERSYVRDEFVALGVEIDRIAAVTEFNGFALSNASNTVDVQVGLDETGDSRIQVWLFDLRATALQVDTGSIDLDTASNAHSAIGTIDDAIDSTNAMRSQFGMVQNRLETAYRQTDHYRIALMDSESTMRDADFAFESAEMTKYQIVHHAGVAVLAQARNINEGATQLIA